MKSRHKKTIYRGEYRGWGLGKKEGGGVFEWDEGGGGWGLIPPNVHYAIDIFTTGILCQS